ncbi:hypothetical protein NZD89_10940 [Alicyclobacillus fastidiosus]|uniref:DUF3592 domain-containing protein n=1 Tax=Alicyclobacillus fastidiosus TaxID=392011 RepID=A0ABY6ZLT7_9BACL|nr:hypothetical protein [Alicyclobacillus fastidiosus]WAH43849.1 hypothetical protein NZD89_10940 [Alicyclobacillus fastidiosus]GMA60086.1 hypothetical protein GCM10025859_05260 [Alicyclobacillus fastidiosus]
MARFLANKRRKPAIRIWLLLLCLPILVVCCVELYKFVIPFNSVNPLWKDVTVGETVIDDWQYEGYDEEGYLRFYNHGQTHLLPPSDHLLALDGQFVVIEESSPNSLTFAPRLYRAIPIRWDLAIVGVVALVILAGWFYLRKRLKSAKHSLVRGFGTKSAGFRPHKRKRGRSKHTRR